MRIIIKLFLYYRKFYDAIINLKELPILFDSLSNNIKIILDNYKDISSISIEY